MVKTNSILFFDILAIFIVAIWGMTFISSAKLLVYFTPAQLFALRFTVAYAGMWFFSHKKLFSESLKDELLLLLAGVMGGSLYFLAENTAIAVSNQASAISFLVCTTPLVTALLAIAIKRENARMTRPLALGSFIALLGVAMVMFNGSAVFGAPLKAYMLALLASLTWAVYTLVVSSISDRYSSAFISRKVFFYGLLTILPVLLTEDAQFNIQDFKRFDVIFHLAFLSLIASLGCYALWTPVIKKIGTIKASNFIYLNPVFTFVGSVIFLDEALSVLSVAGSLVTLLGVWIACSKR